MAKNSVRDFDATAANNTDIQSVDIAENCAPSGINNAIRELMADVKDVSTGTIALESPQADSLTVTGDLTVDTNTLFVDASANAVGLGTLTPSTTLDVVRAGVQPLRVESSSGTEVAINMVNTGGNVQLEAHSGNFNIDADAVGIGTTSGLGGKLDINIGTDARGYFSNSIGEVGTGNFGLQVINSAGSALKPLGFRAEDIRFATGSSERMRILAGGGLTFNGDTAAANALDDYEEGTWTPTIGQGTIGHASAKYTKVGNIVTVTCEVFTFSDRTSSSSVTIGGLPFSGDTFAVSATLARFINTATGGDAVMMFQAPGTTLVPHTIKEADNYDSVQHSELNSTSSYFYISHTYKSV